MKRIILSLLLFFGLTFVYSQNYLISFTAVAPNGTTTFDSIQVLNLTQNTNKTLFFGDVLQLGHLGVTNLNSGNEHVKLYPNPSNGNAELSFYCEASGLTDIKIYDLAGKEITSVSYNLNNGVQKFNISGIKKGMYFIQISGAGFNYTLKLLSHNTSNQKFVIEHTGFEESSLNLKSLKNAASIVFMEYSNGDQLLFKGYSDNYKKIITTIPTSDNTIHFIFIACKDIENNNYATVKIGSQQWMAENLKTNKYRNGDSIPYILIDTSWMNTTRGAYGYYNNSVNMSTVYGNLYNFYAVNDIRKLCPAGWKTPDENDWNSLTAYLGGDLVAGGKMKETGNLTWVNNTAASNSSGFSAFGSGMRSSYGFYSNLGEFSYWWSSDLHDTYNSFYRRLYNLNDNINSDFTVFNDGLNIRCIKDTANMISYLAVLTTIPVTNITITTAHSGGNVTQFGGSAIVNRGLCYSTSPNPTIDDSVVYLPGPSGTGAFIGDIIGLTGGTTYYVRAFAVNAFSVAYGNEQSFTTQLPANGGLSDIDGNVYDTVVIGNQVWMRQNLKVTKYNNGDDLPHITTNAAWSALTGGAYCHYGNNTSTGATYGKLYNYYVVSDNRNVCPQNWHVPHLSEWQTLENYLGGSGIAGGKLKEVDTIYWAAPNADATNSSGFTAYAGGSRSSTGASGDLGYYGNWWTKDEYDPSKGMAMDLSYGNGTSHLYQRTKTIGMSIRCIKDTVASVAVIPNVTSSSASTVTSTTAISGGTIINDGGSAIISKGVCYSTSQNPTITSGTVVNGSGTNTFTSNIFGLLPNTTYYLRAYATNSVGTAYGNQISFTTIQGSVSGMVYDVDGNAYDTVHIGNQIFLKQNLKTTKYNNGDQIPNVTNGSNWGSLTTAAYCNYNNDSINANTYGRLYNWYAVADSRNICPMGWHVSDTADAVELINYLGGSSVAGGKLKEAGLSHWQSPNTGATNSSNFTALPGGYRYYDGNFYQIGNNAWFWAITEYSAITGFSLYMSYDAANTTDQASFKPNGYSVRCIKNQSITPPPPIQVFDIDGNAYDTVQIGTQVWMKQNLKTTKFRNGDALPNYVSNSTYSNLTTAAYSNYNNDTTTANIYGKLYNWYAVNDSRGLCPTGWHIPTDNELSVLASYLNGNTFAGAKLKETGLSHWINPNTGADNSSNFTALPGGVRNSTGNYSSLTYYCYFWSVTESTPSNAWYYYLSYNDVAFNRADNNKKLGHSIRCIKDTVIASYKVYDIDSNAYDTVQIGTQIWMKQNLKTTKYRNGNLIPNVTDSITWAALTTGAYANYNNDTAFVTTYGRLYNYASVADSRNLCPIGWHVPNNLEWSALNTFLGGENVAGGKLKEVGLSHWNAPNYGATNESGFTALPAGNRHYFFGNYGYIGEYAQWWSSNEFNASYAYYESLYRIDSNASFTYTYKNQGFSIRCIKDTALLPFKVIDIDGNAYDTVHIGTQVWLKQNLKTTKFSNGDAIPNYVSNSTYSNLTTAAYSNYNNDTATANIYGKMYNWYAVNDSRGLCPTGWHVPTDNEFSALRAYLGGDTIAGGKLKEVGLFYWALPNTAADNVSGFTALPGGYRNTTGNYFNLTYYCYLWSATESTSTFAWYYYLSYNYATFNRIDNNKKLGHSVRCIKN